LTGDVSFISDLATERGTLFKEEFVTLKRIEKIFPTGGWGSIETAKGTIADGNLLGGRWKPLHYSLQVWFLLSGFLFPKKNCFL
jgi:hypothetical protein